MPTGFGSVCVKHPEINGLRRLVRGNPISNCVKCQSEYKKKNRNRYRLQKLAWRYANPEKQKAMEIKAYPKQKAGIVARTIARKKLLGGQSLAKKYAKEIADFYRGRPVGHHVDHIVPIKGKTVCGLHVPWNLQYLPSRENRMKSNSWGEA